MKYTLALVLTLFTSMTRAPAEFVRTHLCVPQDEISCIVEKTLVCPPGYLDGCISGESRTHTCLPQEGAISCEVDLNLNCPENFTDACLTGDLGVHLCVPVKGPLCTKSDTFSCPSGFEDSCSK